MQYTAEEQDSGLYLRTVLRRSMGISGTAIKSAKWENRVLVNGEAARMNRIVQAGDLIDFIPAETVPVYIPKPYDHPLDILYQDAYMIILNKPAGMASQSSLLHPEDSLENAFYAYLGCPDGFIFRPVNRLDKGTSGLMAVALDAHTQHLLQGKLHSQDFRRFYYAVLEGMPPEMQGTVNAPIIKAAEASIRRIVQVDGRPSVTHYQVISSHNGRTLVRLELETGRTHQIRVHMAHIGCPVFGDFLYGTETPELPGRFALHSAELILRHPYSGEMIHLESPLPEEMTRLME